MDDIEWIKSEERKYHEAHGWVYSDTVPACVTLYHGDERMYKKKNYFEEVE